MIFDKIDLKTASLVEIQEMELGHVATQLIGLGMTNRLCSMEGKEIIAEFGFGGDILDVASALNKYSETIEHVAMTEDIRGSIIKRKILLLDYRNNADSDFKLKQSKFNNIMEAIATRDPKHILEITNIENSNTDIDDAKIRQDALHDAKQCECYANSVLSTYD